METFDATAAKNNFGRLLEASARAPVAIERHGRVVAYVVGAGQMSMPLTLAARIAQRLRAAER